MLTPSVAAGRSKFVLSPRVATPHARRSSRAHASRALVPGPHSGPATLLGGLWLRHPAALRHGGRRGHLPPRHHLARARAAAVERRLCATIAASEGWTLWREPEPAAALLSVPGDPEAVAERHPGSLPSIAAGNRHRRCRARHSLRRGRLGVADARGLGAWLG